MIDETIKRALAQDQVIDITTIGRKSSRPRRIEIWFHRWNGRTYITGLPGGGDGAAASPSRWSSEREPERRPWVIPMRDVRSGWLTSLIGIRLCFLYNATISGDVLQTKLYIPRL